MAKSFV